MRNILLKSLHRINRDQQTLGRFKLDLSKYELYEQMHQISSAMKSQCSGVFSRCN